MPKSIRSLLLFACTVCLASASHGQIPTKCLEIESVLVDACNAACSGANEGENEMFRFIVGPAPIPLGQLSAQWATPNAFLGWVQDAASANVTAQLNATITNCGYLIEPPGGVIPAGKRVLGITSTNMCIAGNSFAQLSDTLYVIYQEPGNTFGHFKNTGSIGPLSATPNTGASYRTFILSVSSPQCSDTATYNIAQLVNAYGTYGGSYTENDGSTIVLSWPGVPQVSYTNYGCQAPIIPLAAMVLTQPDTVPCGNAVELEGATTGNVTASFWSGGTGTFDDPNGNTTTYTPGPDETTGAVLQFCAVGACGDTVCAWLQLAVEGLPTVAITADGPTTFCQGNTVTLTASGGASYTWNTGEQAAAITVDSAGTYTVTGTSSCGQGTADISVEVLPGPTVTLDGPTTVCPGEPVQLIATGGTTYSWSTGEVTDTITATGPGPYSVTAITSCGSATLSIEVLAGEAFQPTFAAVGTAGCAPLCTVFEAEDLGLVEYTWAFSDGMSATGPNVTHCFSAGDHDVTLTVAALDGDPRCPGSVTENAVVHAWPLPVAQFSMDPPAVTIDAPTIQFINGSSGAAYWQWYFGDPGDNTSFLRDPVFVYDAVDCYNVLLVVESSVGCTDSTSSQICVEDTYGLWLPNAFTPNNDGFNDTFFAISTVRDPEIFALDIFDRWGAMIFSSSSLQEGWDGSNTMDGVYAWRARIRDTAGKLHEETGHVVLIR